MAEYLGKAGIITSVSSNISTQPNKEYGCRLTQSIKSKNKVSHPRLEASQGCDTLNLRFYRLFRVLHRKFGCVTG